MIKTLKFPNWKRFLNWKEEETKRPVYTCSMSSPCNGGVSSGQIKDHNEQVFLVHACSCLLHYTIDPVITASTVCINVNSIIQVNAS